MSRPKTPRNGSGQAGRPPRSRRPRPDLAAAAQAAAASVPLPAPARDVDVARALPEPPCEPVLPAPDPVRPLTDDMTAMSLSLLDLYRQATEAQLTFWTTLLGQDVRSDTRRDDEAA